MKNKLLSKKYAKFFRYILGGVSTTLLNAILFTLLIYIDIRYYWANLIAIIATKIYAYFINKLYVYKSITNSWNSRIREMYRFVLTRGGTGLLDYILVIVLVECIHLNALLSKYVVLVCIILLNYILGNKYVFTSGNKV